MDQYELQRAYIDKKLRELANTPKKLEAYQELVDRDLCCKDNLQMIEDNIEDPRIDNY